MNAPEVRIDQLTGLRAILAPGRAERPDAFAPPPAERSEDAAETCPFCEGREDRTPPEVWADGPAAARRTRPAGRRGRSRTSIRCSAVGSPTSDRSERGGRERAAVETGLASSIDPLGASTRGRRARPVRVAARPTAPTR